MSYHYGSDSLDIPNPFKKEGLLFITSGAIILTTGLISLFNLNLPIPANGPTAGSIKLLISAFLLIMGSKYLFSGFLKLFRFYVGRDVPTSLSKNLAPSESHVNEPNLLYSPQELNQMLMGRKNPTFVEPKTFVDKLLFSICPQFLFLPYVMRNFLHSLAKRITYTFVLILTYFIILFSSSSGLIKLTNPYFSKWLGALLLLFLFLMWCGNKLPLGKINSSKVESDNAGSLVSLIIFSILIPAAGEFILRQKTIMHGIIIPKLVFDSTPYILLTLILACISVAGTVILAIVRSGLIEPLTEVSEYRNHWQENVHPKDIFRCFDMEMVNLRYKEIPNRIYNTLNPQLVMEGSDDKGSFSGDTMQETQPVYEKIKSTSLYGFVRALVSAYGHILISLSAVLLLTTVKNLPNVFTLDTVMKSFYLPVVLWIFGTISINVAHIFWSELFFKSILAHFHGDGTYTESKISVGMSIVDSTRSENRIVRTSFTPWILLSEIITSTFAGIGSNNLESSRYVLHMKKSDHLLNELTNGIRNYLGGQSVIADVISENDMETISKNYNINQLSPINKDIKAVKTAIENKLSLNE